MLNLNPRFTALFVLVSTVVLFHPVAGVHGRAIRVYNRGDHEHIHSHGSDHDHAHIHIHKHGKREDARLLPHPHLPIPPPKDHQSRARYNRRRHVKDIFTSGSNFHEPNKESIVGLGLGLGVDLKSGQQVAHEGLHRAAPALGVGLKIGESNIVIRETEAESSGHNAHPTTEGSGQGGQLRKVDTPAEAAKHKARGRYQKFGKPLHLAVKAPRSEAGMKRRGDVHIHEHDHGNDHKHVHVHSHKRHDKHGHIHNNAPHKRSLSHRHIHKHVHSHKRSHKNLHEHVHVHSHKRDEDVTSGVPGTIDIVSVGPNPNDTSTFPQSFATVQKLASLVLAANDTNRHSFILNASNSSQTQVYMLAQPDDPNSTSGMTKRVSLGLQVFSKENATMLSYCASYDPNPPVPAPLTAEPCNSTETENFSQIFAYDPTNGVIQPLWFAQSSVGTMTNVSDADSNVTLTKKFAIPPSSNIQNNFPSENLGGRVHMFAADQTNSSMPTTIPDLSNAQNVTLIFTPTTDAIIPAPASNMSASSIPIMDAMTAVANANSLTAANNAVTGEVDPCPSSSVSGDMPSSFSLDNNNNSTVDAFNGVPSPTTSITSTSTAPLVNMAVKTPTAETGGKPYKWTLSPEPRS